MKVNIHCSHCQGVFEFEHPSVSAADDLAHVTLDCKWCGVTLKAPDDEIWMITMKEYMDRSLRRMGVDPTQGDQGFLEVVSDDMRYTPGE